MGRGGADLVRHPRRGWAPRDVDFTGFAKATVAAAKARYGATGVEVAAVREAWRTVKVPLRVTHRNR